MPHPFKWPCDKHTVTRHFYYTGFISITASCGPQRVTSPASPVRFLALASSQYPGSHTDQHHSGGDTPLPAVQRAERLLTIQAPTPPPPQQLQVWGRVHLITKQVATRISVNSTCPSPLSPSLNQHLLKQSSKAASSSPSPAGRLNTKLQATHSTCGRIECAEHLACPCHEADGFGHASWHQIQARDILSLLWEGTGPQCAAIHPGKTHEICSWL